VPDREPKADAHDIRERESFAKDEMCKDLKQHYTEKGVERTGESIEREVREIQEDVFKRKDHDIYKG
jgi:glutamate mutase epsilon subunit